MSDFQNVPQNKKFHADLQVGDTETLTVGCRHTNPDICRKNGMEDVCAFERSDGRCLAPPASWAKSITPWRSV